MEDKLAEKETEESLSREKTIQEEDDGDSIKDDEDDTTDDDDIEDEEDKEDDNNDEDDSPTKNPATATLTTTETSENESEATDSESEPERSGDDIVKAHEAKSMQECLDSSQPISNIGALPAKSVTKRPMTEVGQNDKEIKQMRQMDEEKKKPEEGEGKIIGVKDTKKQLFKRLFSEDDEITILEGMLKFLANNKDPYNDIDGFYNFVKASIGFNATKTQLTDKIQALRRKFETLAKRGRPSSKCHEQILFDLSKHIWSDKGSLQSTLECAPKPLKKNEVANDENKCMSSKQMTAFLKKDNLIGLDHLMQWWDKVEEPKKREAEKKMMNLFMQHDELKSEVRKLVYEAFEASKTDV